MRALAGPNGLRLNCSWEFANVPVITSSVSSLPLASSPLMSSPSDGVGAATVRALASNFAFLLLHDRR